MNRKISLKFLGITAVLFISFAIIIGFIVSKANKESITETAQSAVKSHVQNINANLETVDDLLKRRVSSSMKYLQAISARTGAPSINGTAAIGGVSVPNLYLGGTSQTGNYGLVDEIYASTEATATLFVRKGNDFIRVSTNVKNDNGSRAIGTQLDPNGKAIKNIRNGESFYGVVDILGSPYMTGYEPMFDRNKNVIGIWYVGYPVSAMQIIGKIVEESKILQNGYIAILDHNGKVLFKSQKISEEEVLNHIKLMNGSAGEEWVINSQNFDPWNFKIISAYPQEDIDSHTRKAVFQISMFLAIIAFGLLVMVYFLLKYIILNAVNKLAEASEKIARGDYSVLVESKAKDELGKLAEAFNYMASNIRGAIENAAQKEKEAREALKQSETLNKEILSREEY
ncbi:MAG TPA: Cache 3/Cache 2 fusion domain-containing protein, partial [Ignavibacteriales bacterium]|nr:Cache 3/Cache 2 fusion domain-containing protein [Ignavibacteriales bacterium]